MPSPPWASISLPGELTVTTHTAKAQQSASLHLGSSLNTSSPEAFPITLPNPLQSPRRFLIIAPPTTCLFTLDLLTGLLPVSLHWDVHFKREWTSSTCLLLVPQPLKKSAGRIGKLSSRVGSKQSCGLQAGPEPSLPFISAGRMQKQDPGAVTASENQNIFL